MCASSCTLSASTCVMLPSSVCFSERVRINRVMKSVSLVASFSVGLDRCFARSSGESDKQTPAPPFSYVHFQLVRCVIEDTLPLSISHTTVCSAVSLFRSVRYSIDGWVALSVSWVVLYAWC